MSENEVLDTSVAGIIAAARIRFPLIYSYLDSLPPRENNPRFKKWPEKTEIFALLVDTFEEGMANNAIPNKIYQDGKQSLNRIISDAWTHLISEKYMHAGRYQQFDILPEKQHNALRAVEHPELHRLDGLQRKARALDIEHPIKDDMLAFFAETVPLAVLNEQLKTMTVKRVVRTDAEREPNYDPPIPGTKAQAVVLAALMAITEPAYIDLRDAYDDDFTEQANLYAALKKEAHAESMPMSVVLAFGQKGKKPSPHLCNTLSRLVERSPTDKHSEDLVPKYKDIIAKMAEKSATEVRAVFLHRNLAKIAPIVDGKGNLESAHAVSGTRISISGLEGRIHVSFTDGSRFNVQTAVVHHENQFGTRYHRVPVTFHNVFLPDGSKMVDVNEERMNEVFAKTTAAPVDAPAKKITARRSGMTP